MEQQDSEALWFILHNGRPLQSEQPMCIP